MASCDKDENLERGAGRIPTYRLLCALCEIIVAENVELEESIKLAKEHEVRWHTNRVTCYVRPEEHEKTDQRDGQ
jgi:hypothetical protein